ncbi:NADPH-dependent FMN reductase [Alteromonas oceanisediminis]|uniref:NADPH-dependent FMN reductase n=1 Tax=Alteromonas oceanisediminis TaxID=2836180 RepID=UPI001BDAA562|nr:NAD(P)H-dependent oxidoreductase [Alteromonas oceanisediminis]MBT0584839.1 NAD(P)H-dependent oxidoreductase [Alteromonas oceanisediminis]
MVKILAFSGSARKNSFNQAVATAAADAARNAGAEVTLVNLGDYPMPIFNEDDEAASGMPDQARAFKELLLSHDAFIIVSPEYNSSYPALLKNAIDWASRKQSDEKPLEAFRGKTALIMAASAGALGGMRVLVTLRMLLGNIGVNVLANQKAIGKVDTLMNDSGQLTDEKTLSQIAKLVEELATTTQKLK